MLRRVPPGRAYKYGPLQHYLAAQPRERRELPFAQIEQISGAPLPPSVWSRTWWTNAAHLSQA